MSTPNYEDRAHGEGQEGGTTMTEYTDDQRARARALHHQFYQVLTGRDISGTILGPLSSARVKAWLELEEFVLQSHVCEPMWRPTTRDEIQAGWEVRSRYSSGPESTWGIAHKRGGDGDWYTETGAVLTWDAMGWSYETTAPLPEPEQRIAVVRKYYQDADIGSSDDGIRDLLARLDACEEGGQP